MKIENRIEEKDEHSHKLKKHILKCKNSAMERETDNYIKVTSVPISIAKTYLKKSDCIV